MRLLGDPPMNSAAYASLREAVRRLETAPPGQERDHAVQELRAALRGLRGEELRQLLTETHRFLRPSPEANDGNLGRASGT